MLKPVWHPWNTALGICDKYGLNWNISWVKWTPSRIFEDTGSQRRDQAICKKTQRDTSCLRQYRGHIQILHYNTSMKRRFESLCGYCVVHRVEYNNTSHFIVQGATLILRNYNKIVGHSLPTNNNKFTQAMKIANLY